jgi:hypothetical protein
VLVLLDIFYEGFDRDELFKKIKQCYTAHSRKYMQPWFVSYVLKKSKMKSALTKSKRFRTVFMQAFLTADLNDYAQRPCRMLAYPPSPRYPIESSLNQVQDRRLRVEGAAPSRKGRELERRCHPLRRQRLKILQ